MAEPKDVPKKFPKRSRGSGSLYSVPGTDIIWCQYYVGGLRQRESTGETSIRKAGNYLDNKIAEVRVNGRPAPTTLTVAALVEAKLVSDRNNGRKDVGSSEGRWKIHLQPFLGHLKARDLTTPILDKYIEKRKQELLAKYAKSKKGESDADYEERMDRNRSKSPNGTINRELSFLRSAFNLAKRSRLVRDVPWFPMLKEDNVRTGFLQPGKYEKLAAACMAEGLWLRTLFELGCAYGWRRSEMIGRLVRDVDFLGGPNGEGTISLPTSKNGDPRIVTLTRKVRELLLECCKGKSPDDRLLTRDGQPVVDYRDAWARALKAAKIERDLHVHDLRRTAIRGMRDRGVDRHVAMKITGHRTESVYNRYNIVDLKDIAKATAALDAEQKSQKNQSSQDDQNSHSSAITEPAKPPQEEAGNVEVTAIQEDDGRPGGIRTPDPRFRKSLGVVFNSLNH